MASFLSSLKAPKYKLRLQDYAPNSKPKAASTPPAPPPLERVEGLQCDGEEETVDPKPQTRNPKPTMD